MSTTGGRMSRRAFGYLAGAGLAGAAFASPVAEEVARHWAIPGEGQSVRRRWYFVDSDWMRDALSLADVRRDEPAGHRTLPLFASSEVTTQVDENPAHLLYDHVNDFDLLYRGHALHQSLVHAIDLASLAQDLAQPRAALVVSAQWFTPSGMKPRQFASVFSGSQFLRMRQTSRISRGTRQALLDRAAALRTDPLWLGPDSELQHLTVGPYRRTMRHAHALQEVSRGTRAVAPLSGAWEQAADAVPATQVDWAHFRSDAATQAEAAITNNPFNIDDGYFDANLKGRLDFFKDSLAKVDYSLDGPEWDDLALVFRVAADAGVQLLVIGQPFNGAWYDHMGYDATRRARYAARLRRVTRQHGHQFLDLFGHEYELGFMHDATHLGWKGWIDVTRALVGFAAA